MTCAPNVQQLPLAVASNGTPIKQEDLGSRLLGPKGVLMVVLDKARCIVMQQLGKDE